VANFGTVSRHLLGKTVKTTVNPRPDRDLKIGTRIYKPEMLRTRPRCSIKHNYLRKVSVFSEDTSNLVKFVGANSARGSANPSFP
jgi:hypothetical protein